MNIDDALGMLDRLVTAYPNQTISGKTLALYADRLKKFTEHQIRIAIANSIDRDAKFPSLKALIERASAAPRDLGNVALLPTYEDVSGTLDSTRVRHFRKNEPYTQMPSTLAGQSYSEDELAGRDGKRAIRNNVFDRARDAQLDKFSERFPNYNPPEGSPFK